MKSNVIHVSESLIKGGFPLSISPQLNTLPGISLKLNVVNRKSLFVIYKALCGY